MNVEKVQTKNIKLILIWLRHLEFPFSSHGSDGPSWPIHRNGLLAGDGGLSVYRNQRCLHRVIPKSPWSETTVPIGTLSLSPCGQSTIYGNSTRSLHGAPPRQYALELLHLVGPLTGCGRRYFLPGRALRDPWTRHSSSLQTLGLPLG